MNLEKEKLITLPEEETILLQHLITSSSYIKCK